MADRYWVGGTGTWDGTNTANWSASSGGASGASVPTSADNVFFDAASNVGTGAFTVTMATTPRACLDITISNLDGAMTLAGSGINLNVSGSLSFPSTNLTITYTGTTGFVSTTTGRTINTGGLTFQGPVTFSGTGGGWQLQGALTTLDSVATTLTAGALDLNNFTITTGRFVSGSSNTRSIAFGTTGSIVLNTTTAASVVISMATTTGFTFTGTSNFSTAMSVTRTFDFGSTAGATAANRVNVNLTSGASVPTFTGSFRQVNFTGSTCNPGAATINCGGFTLDSGGTYTSTTFSINSSAGTTTFNGKTISAFTINSVSAGVVLQDAATVSGTTTLTSGVLNLNDLTITTALFSSNNTNVRSIAFGSTGSIVVNSGTAGATVVQMSDNSNFTFTGTSNISAAMTTTRTFNISSTGGGAAAARLNINLTSGASVPTFTGGGFRRINFTGSTCNPGTATINCGSFTLASGGTYTSTTFSINTSAETATFIGKTISALTIDAISSTLALQDAGTVSGDTTLTSGTLDLTNLTLTTGRLLASNTNTRSIAFGSTGSIVLNTTTAASTVLSFGQAFNFTFTGTSNISTAMTVTRTFQFSTGFGGGGDTAANRLNINLTSGASLPTFSGSFRQVNFTGSTCNPGASGSVTIDCGGFTLASGGTYTAVTFNANDCGGTLTFNGKPISRLAVNCSPATVTLLDNGSTSSSAGSSSILSGTLNLNNFTFACDGFSASGTATRSISFGTSGVILINGSTVGNGFSALDPTGFSFTGTSNISAAMSVARTFTFGQLGNLPTDQQLVNLNFISGASAPTAGNGQSRFRKLDFTGSTCTPGNFNCTAFTLASGGTYTSTNFTLSATTAIVGDLTFNGKTIAGLTLSCANATATLADSGGTISNNLTLINGTFNLNNNSLTTSSASTLTGTKNITFNGGTLVISGSTATAWNNANPTGFTTTAGTGTGAISMTGASAKTFVGGGSIYNCTLNQGGVGTLTITGANTFNDITDTVPTASQITFPASTTTTVNNFTLSGTAGNLVSIRSSTPGTQFTLSDPSGLVTANYLDIQDSNATGGAIWTAYLYNGNVDSGNNTGWLFVPTSFMLFFN